jgi:hypothetical protein
MTSLSGVNAGRFRKMRDHVTAGINLVSAQMRLAAKASDGPRHATLLKRRQELERALPMISDAEDAFQRASMSVNKAEALLKGAVNDATGAVDSMRRLVEFLRKADELVKIATGLVRLFP